MGIIGAGNEARKSEVPSRLLIRTVAMDNLTVTIVIVVRFDLTHQRADAVDALLHGVQILCKMKIGSE